MHELLSSMIIQLIKTKNRLKIGKKCNKIKIKEDIRNENLPQIIGRKMQPKLTSQIFSVHSLLSSQVVGRKLHPLTVQESDICY